MSPNTIEEKRRQHILEIIEAMAGGVPSPERLEEDLDEKRSPKPDKFTAQELQAYEEDFLYPEHFQNKISCSLNRHTIESLRYILSQLQPNISLAAYIDHIIWEHLRSYQELLNRAIDQSRRKTIISDKL